MIYCCGAGLGFDYLTQELTCKKCGKVLGSGALEPDAERPPTPEDALRRIEAEAVKLCSSPAPDAFCEGLRQAYSEVGQIARDGLALAAATGTAKTPKAVECEASQSGGDSRNAQTQSEAP
jgi:hypothetical protein